MRPSIDSIMMKTAELFSMRGTCTRKQVGAVIAQDTRIISTGYVGSPEGEKHCVDEGCIMENGGCTRTVHAEVNAIVYAARNQADIKGATMYVTLSPCQKCAELIYLIGISRVVYGEEYRIQKPIKYLQNKGIQCELQGII